MKICYLADGRSIHTQRWLRYFASKGHEVHLIIYDSQELPPEEEMKNLGIKVHCFAPKFEEKLERLNHTRRICLMRRELKLKRLLRKIKPDILHSHFVEKYGWWGARSGFHPFVLTAWGSDIYICPRRSQKSRERISFALKQADLITSDSEDLRRATIELGASPDRSYIVQFGVDLTRFNPKVDPSAVRKKLKLGDSPVVLSSRGFRPIYNNDVLVRAIPLILKEVLDAKFILKNRYEAKGAELKRLVRELKVDGSVRFVDSVEYNEMPGYYAASDVFVSIPSSDATSVALLEAMACGVAPVVSDLPSAREWIKNGENGYIVPARDPEALAKAIVRLLKDEVTRKLFIKRNLFLIEEKANHHKHMERMERLYYSLINQ